MSTPDLPDLARRVAALEERLDMEAASELRAGGACDLAELARRVGMLADVADRRTCIRLDTQCEFLVEIRGLLRDQRTVLAEHGAALVAIAEILHRLPGADEDGADEDGA